MARNRKAFFGGLRLSQQGAVLILMAFILGLGTVAYLLKAFDAASLQAKQDAKTYQTLKEAKAALIAWAVNHPNTPGLMPYPDRNGDGNYDDASDCYASNVSFNTQFTLGRLPLFLSDPNCVAHDTFDLSGAHDVTAASGVGEDFRDGAGERLWYEVSSNLLHDYKSTGTHSNGTSPIINPDIVNNPSSPWFVVRDRNGVVISNRVAAVIISAGAPAGAQDRSSGIADANQYLDKIVMADGTPYKNYGYQVLGVTPVQEFIIGDDLRVVAKNDPTYKNQSIEPYYYNDKLVYITIDELMAALEKRVAAEVKAAVSNYKQATSYMPYAAIVGGHKNSSCVVGKLSGALPIAPSHSSSCTFTGVSSTSSTSSCSFSEIDSVIFTKTGSNFSSSTGACQFNGKVCTCRGLGSCRRTTRTFTCNTTGVCSANMSGTYQFLGGGFDSVMGKCSSSCGSDVTCSGTGGGSFSHGNCTDSAFNDAVTNSKLPTWLIDNQWQDYIYYAAQRGASSTISAGGKSGIKALTITTGFPIITAPFAMSKGGAQSHLSCNLSDSLDTNVNVNGSVTNMYEALNKPRTPNYNDQIFVITP